MPEKPGESPQKVEEGGERSAPAQAESGSATNIEYVEPGSAQDNQRVEIPRQLNADDLHARRGTSEAPLHRRILVSDVRDDSRRIPQGTRTREETEYVAVPRKVTVKEEISGIPVQRLYQDIEPQWKTQTIVRQIPKEKIEYEDHVTQVAHKRVIDEYVEKPYDAGVEVKCVPRVEVQEREVEVKIPRIIYETREEEIPEVREVVRYVESDNNVEQVIRYMPDSPGAPETSDQPQLKEYSSDDESSLDSPMQGVVMPKKARYRGSGYEAGMPMTIDIPVPFLVPKPLCIGVDVPLIKFRDNFVPVPVRRHVTPKLTFTDEVYEVPCVREKPALIVSDAIKPVPVDCHIRIREKDVQIKPMDPEKITQADMHAMWMRTNADLLDTFKIENEGKLPRGLHVPEEQKVQLREEDWEAVLEKQLAAEMGSSEDDSTSKEGKEDLGPLPLHPGHPLMMTWLQGQWMQNPSNETHAMYTADFLRKHMMAVNNTMDPQCHAVNLTEQQMQEIGQPEADLPNPWTLVNLIKDNETDKAQTNQRVEREAADHLSGFGN